MDNKRKTWNEGQKTLRHALLTADAHHLAVSCFLAQHACLHVAEVSQSGAFSFEDEVLAGLSDADLRFMPAGGQHSILWVLWHLTRIEDMVMTVLIADVPQLFHQAGWQVRINSRWVDTGNGMTADEIAEMCATLDVATLRQYRLAVGQNTREIVKNLPPACYKTKVDAARLARLQMDGSVAASEQWLLDYWGGLTIAGLLLMPPTRHVFVHLNEMAKIRQKVLKVAAKP